MLKFAEAQEKVNHIVGKFVDMLYGNYPIDRYRILQYTMALLCKAKGECLTLSKVDNEYENYGIPLLTIDTFINDIREACGNNLNEILPQSADYLLAKFSNDSWGEFLQPRELTNLVLSLMKEKGCKRIYNPFAGFASYALGDFIESYYGQEINFATCNLAKMRLELNNSVNSIIENCDSIKDWNEHDADCIVATSPFGGMIDEKFRHVYHAKSFDEYLLSRFISGQAKYALYVMPRGICFHSHSTAFDLRKTICEKNLLDMVINLPSGIFSSTGISTSLIVLNRCRKDGDEVLLVNAEDAIIKVNRREKRINFDAVLKLLEDRNSEEVCKVSSKELFLNDCSFDYSRYVKLDLEVKEGQQIITLGDVLTQDRGELCDFNDVIVENVIESSSFVDDINKLGDVNNSILVNQPKCKFHGPHLAISMQGKVYVHTGNTDFYIGQALSRFVFKVDESVVDTEYLAYTILSNRILQRHYFGAGMARINVRQLLKYKIVIDNLSRQKQIMGRLKRTYLANEKQRLGIRDAGGDLSHMLGGPKDSIGNLIDLLLDSDHINEEERGWLKAIDDNFNYMMRLVNIVGADFSSLSENNTEIHIAEFLRDYVRSLKNLKISYCYHIKEEIGVDESVTVKCDEDLIRVILDAAFRNAYKHGFVQQYQEKNMVKLECKAVLYDGIPFVCIRIANNGKPLEDGFSLEDFATRGKTAGSMGNTGKGGYHIYTIAKKYGGYINVSSSLEWPFILDVLIPVNSFVDNKIILEYGDKCL